jgi:hypothetical protein
VVFVPEEAGGRGATGFTGADGHFTLTTFQAGDGAFPGQYKILIQVPGEMEVPADLTTPEDVQRAMGARVQVKKAALALPAVYTAPDKTILRQAVPADGLVKLALRSDAK